MFRFPFTNFHELNLDWILSVVKEAKTVFDSGRIVQKGTHDELLREETGKYRELWEAQAQYYVAQ